MRSWNAWYGLYAVMIVFGGIGLTFSGSLADSWKWHEGLVNQGKPTIGRVTKLSSSSAGDDDTNYNIYYKYTVNGQSFEGVGDTTASEFMRYHDGDPIPLTYLPSDPKTSDYRPQDWTDSQKKSNRISQVLMPVGCALALVTGLLDIRRRTIGNQEPDPIGSRTYLTRSVVSVFGFIFMTPGVYFQIDILRQIFSGQQIVFTVNGVPEVAGPAMKVLLALFPVIFWCIGASFVLFGHNFRLVVTDSGIRVRDMRGRWWEAAWSDLRILRQDSSGFKITDGTHKVWIQNYIEQSADLQAEIKSRLASRSL